MQKSQVIDNINSECRADDVFADFIEDCQRTKARLDRGDIDAAEFAERTRLHRRAVITWVILRAEDYPPPP